MCYRTKLNSRIREIEKTFSAKFIAPEDYFPAEEVNAFDFGKTPVIADENQGEIQFFHWGLIPKWARNSAIRSKTLNAKIETVTEKPSFQHSVGKRCLIIANGYYEWQWQDPRGRKKQKFLITPKEQEIFAFAGLYATWLNPENGILVSSYTITTTVANDLMSEIHNNKKRMPVVLRKEDQKKWLKGDEIRQFAFPYEVDLTATPVG